ncbi:hypothetical protein EDB80DRAFT_872952 [Ilyonectria destructans]|nr:hypothetical protein EDB80DRAFT_872952 [Ilyonectria destructans]
MTEDQELNKDWADPRVTGFDNFTKTVHHKPGATLQSSLSLQTPYNVCVVGASRGIGAGIARSYAKAGASTIILAARNTQQLQDVASQIADINPRCVVYSAMCDIASPSSVRDLAAFTREKLGQQQQHLNAVIVNSGYANNRELDVTEGDATDEFWAQSFAVNTLGTYHVAHYMVPLLLKAPEDAGRAFLVVGTVAALIRRGSIAPSKYCISKLAQMRITEHVAEQFGSRGLFSAVVHPGAVATEMALDASPDDNFKQYLIDDPELCGYFFVWLTRQPGSLQWLNGRFLSAKWDPDELIAQKQQVLEGDLLKLELRAD